MVKCPKCNEEINHLICYFHNTFTIYLKFNGTYKKLEGIPFRPFCYNKKEYMCPKCYKVLFNNSEDAKKFLVKK
ncbi:MAG: hypothetical protein QXM27_02770 [Candidatus Pacearchaeota archaeon]